MKTLQLKKSVLDTQSVDFIEHTGEGEEDNYLVMNIPFAPVAELFSQLIQEKKCEMTSRAEAHITILRPSEFWSILRPVGITIGEINDLARKMEIQSTRFCPVCLGEGISEIDGKQESTFYIIVDSPAARAIRSRIKDLYISRGGDSDKFCEDFCFHITVGFTKRDLHEKDGVIKDESTCEFKLELT